MSRQNSSQAEFIYHQQEKFTTNGVYFSKLADHPTEYFSSPQSHSPTGLFSNRVSPGGIFSNRTNTSLQLIIFGHYPQREQRTQLLILSNSSPEFILPSWRILQEHCISIHHGMRIRIMRHNLIYFENIIT